MTKDRLFNKGLALSAMAVVVVLAAMALSLAWGSAPALKQFGFGFFTGQTWDPNPESGAFGVMPFLAGTLVTSFLALAISLPFSLSLAFLLGEYVKTRWISGVMVSLVDLIAAVPSVIYGFWGLMVLVPLVQELAMKLNVAEPYGTNVLSASLVLSIMVVPNTASLAREVVAMVPADLKEAAYAMGATRFEVVRRVVFPYARPGILAGVLLSLGRALGETMAVTMVIGNMNEMPKGLFAPANTMASVMANELAEATGDAHYSALIAVGLTLFLVTTLINVAGTWLIRRMSVQP